MEEDTNEISIEVANKEYEQDAVDEANRSDSEAVKTLTAIVTYLEKPIIARIKQEDKTT